MGSEHIDCDLCGLNRATLHLDETRKGTFQMTAHLCADCWYRLGIRVPLGNIWDHIRRAKEDLVPPGDKDPIEEVEELFEVGEEDLGELLHPGSLAVAEPDDDPEGLGEGIDESLLGQENPPDRGKEDVSELENLLKDVDETQYPPRQGPLGIPAVRVDRIHPSLVNLIPLEMLRRCKAIPVQVEGSSLTVAVADPFDTVSLADLEAYVENLGFVFVQAFADEGRILEELNRHDDPPKRFESLS